MDISNGNQIIHLLREQRNEDQQRETERHKEVLKLIADTSEKVVRKIDAHALETDIQFKKHYKYHKDNEPIWSYNVFKWLDEHKKLIFIFGIIIGAIVIVGGTYFGFNWKDILKGIIKKGS